MAESTISDVEFDSIGAEIISDDTIKFEGGTYINVAVNRRKRTNKVWMLQTTPFNAADAAVCVVDKQKHNLSPKLKYAVASDHEGYYLIGVLPTC